MRDRASGGGGPVRWLPTYGAWLDTGGTRFRVWAPAACEVRLAIERPDDADDERPLRPAGDGTFVGWMPDVCAGSRYWYRLDSGPPLPDPASRFQPDGVHGPSEVVDPDAFEWSDAGWPGATLDRASIYELHVGTFSPDGTFAGATARLPYLRDLGVTILELMPVADFAGDRNWGYDGVCPFAPARCYGRPDDLRRLVDEAHRLGLAVLLDVVYNHLGPDGAYIWRVSPAFFTDRHRSPWGQGVNVDGPGSEHVRRFVVDNALHWIHDYHVDGLRLDATHAIADDSPVHIAAEIAARVHAEPGPARLVVAEDHRNLADMIRAPGEGGWGLDAVWADDFHHQIRRLLAGDADGYYADFTGTTTDLATTIRRGWFFCEQRSGYLAGPRGTDPSGVPSKRFVVCLQNHDQVGNRALGERLHHQIPPAAWRAAVALLLLAPQTPLLFMGQEWATTTPFLYFTDHHEQLGRQVTAGRRQEFGRFSAFADPAARERIPDPQSPGTFEASRLRWLERDADPHRGVWRLHQALLALRRTEPALGPDVPFDAEAPDARAVVVRFDPPAGAALAVVAQLAGGGRVTVDPVARRAGAWRVVLTTEDPAFADEPHPPVVEGAEGERLVVRFGGPSTVVVRWT